MSYVMDDDIFSSEEDLSSSAVSVCFEDDESEGDEDIDYAILADLANPAETRGLQGEALKFEKPVLAGIHVWSGIKEALEHTFEGWPDSPEYEAFCRVVRAELENWKHRPSRGRDLEGFGIDMSINPIVDKHVQMFLSYPDNPLAKSKSAKKLEMYKSILKIMAKGVKYLTAETRQKYEITLAAQLTRTGTGNVFCTESLWNRKRRSSLPGSQLSSKHEGKNKRCIWVMTEGAGGAITCYSHFGKIGAFHHSSFTAGDGIMAAGEWYVEQGKCTLINALSGHYKPEPWRFLRALKVLSDKGVLQPDTEVQVFTKFFPAGEETRLNAQQFLNNWADNIANYDLHPDA